MLSVVTSFAENRKAHYEYETLEKFDGGLVLTGQEVKSVRDGGARLDGSYIKIVGGELWFIGLKISPYKKAGPIKDYDPEARRKILVTKKQLTDLLGKTQQKGLTLVPFSLYPSGRRIKVAFGLCRGKKTHDKKEKLKEQDVMRQTQRFLRGRDE